MATAEERTRQDGWDEAAGHRPVDLLVVGGGPVGVATALLAAQHGMSTRVLERNTEVYDLPRAIVIDDEVQRIFQSAGLGEGLAAITTAIRGGEFLGPDGTRVMGIELADDQEWQLGHRPVVAFYQPQLESFLRAAAAEAGVEMLPGHTVTGLDQQHHFVSVTAELPGERPSVHQAEWVVAADGAGSPIRKALGIRFEDLGFDQDWLVVDTRLRRDGVDLPALAQQICDPARPVTYVPGHDAYRRWEFQLQAGESIPEMERPERIWELLAPWVGPDDVELVRAVVYRFHATVASTMREGRVFLAGDAAHQMPPFLGQGLCSGLRDSANLAWKLAAVAAGRAGDALLDTYDAERRPHAAGVVAHAMDAGRLIDQLAGRRDSGVDVESAYGGQRPFPHLEAGFLAGGSDLVGRQLPQPRLPDGSLLDTLLGDGTALILDERCDQLDSVRVAAELLGARIVQLPPETGERVCEGRVLVVRPDRYVAADAVPGEDLIHSARVLAGVLAAPDTELSR